MEFSFKWSSWQVIWLSRSLFPLFLVDEGLLVEQPYRYFFLTPLSPSAVPLSRCQSKMEKINFHTVMKANWFKLEVEFYFNILRIWSTNEATFQSALIWCQNVHIIWINKYFLCLWKGPDDTRKNVFHLPIDHTAFNDFEELIWWR